MKNLLKPTLIALSLATATIIPNTGIASGIPTVDAAGIATTIAENLKTLTQLKEQLDAAQQQIAQYKQFADDTKKRLEGNWNLGEIVANDSFLNSLPSSAKDILMNNTGLNIDSLRNTYGLKSDNSAVQNTYDALIRYTERTKEAYENTVKRIANLDKLKQLADAADTPAKKADVANQFAYEKIKYDQEQAALKQLEESIKAQEEIKANQKKLDFANKMKMAKEAYQKRNAQ